MAAVWVFEVLYGGGGFKGKLRGKPPMSWGIHSWENGKKKERNKKHISNCVGKNNADFEFCQGKAIALAELNPNLSGMTGSILTGCGGQSQKAEFPLFWSFLRSSGWSFLGVGTPVLWF